ncbi:hypothetical protein TKK_0001668 [Trichogramma kaykai]
MVKLVCNALLTRNIVNGEEKMISWEFIRKLVKIQGEEGLHLATKIRRRYIEPDNKKMKVCLAFQVLSKSAAAALKTCEYELELKEFENANATARFCRVINDCSDLLNSKNIFNKCPRKSSITRQNLDDFRVKESFRVKILMLHTSKI